MPPGLDTCDMPGRLMRLSIFFWINSFTITFEFYNIWHADLPL